MGIGNTTRRPPSSPPRSDCPRPRSPAPAPAWTPTASPTRSRSSKRRSTASATAPTIRWSAWLLWAALTSPQSAGFMAEAARRGVPVLLDGLISVACALMADRLAPGAAAWFAAGHRSTEPAQASRWRSSGSSRSWMCRCASAKAAAPWPRFRSCARRSRSCATSRCSRTSCRADGLVDGLRLAIGTLTALPVRPPARVDQRTARMAVLLAPPADAAPRAGRRGHAVADAPARRRSAGVRIPGRRRARARLARVPPRWARRHGRRAHCLVRPRAVACRDEVRFSRTRRRGSWVCWHPAVETGGRFRRLSDEPLAAGVLVLASRAALALTCIRGIPAAAGEGLRGAAFAGVHVSWPLALLRWVSAGGDRRRLVLTLAGCRGRACVVGFVWRTVVVGSPRPCAQSPGSAG